MVLEPTILDSGSDLTSSVARLRCKRKLCDWEERSIDLD